MQNEEGKFVELYIPRKCSATNRLIPAKEHGSIQLNVGEVDSDGRYTGKFKTVVISGFVRRRGESDSSLNRIFHSYGPASAGPFNVMEYRRWGVMDLTRAIFAMAEEFDLVVRVQSGRDLGVTSKAEAFPYACVDWGGQSFFTEVLSRTLKPQWKKGTFRLPLVDGHSLLHQTLPISVYNCDRTGKGDDEFLGSALIDLYAAMPPIESVSARYSSRRQFDDWIPLEGGPSASALLRVHMEVQPRMVEEEDQPAVVREESPSAEYGEPEVVEEEGSRVQSGSVSVVPSTVGADLMRPIHEKSEFFNHASIPSRRLSRLVSNEEGNATLSLRIVQAKDLITRSSFVSEQKRRSAVAYFPTAYCTFDWNGETITTSAVEHSVNPIWPSEDAESSSQLPLSLNAIETPLIIQVRDYDSKTQEDVGTLGFAKIDLARIPPNVSTDFWTPIQGARGQLRCIALLEGDDAMLRDTQSGVNQSRQQETEADGETIFPYGTSLKAGAANISSQEKANSDAIAPQEENETEEEDEVFDLISDELSDDDRGEEGGVKELQAKEGRELRRIQSEVRETPSVKRPRGSFASFMDSAVQPVELDSYGQQRRQSRAQAHSISEPQEPHTRAERKAGGTAINARQQLIEPFQKPTEGEAPLYGEPSAPVDISSKRRSSVLAETDALQADTHMPVRGREPSTLADARRGSARRASQYSEISEGRAGGAAQRWGLISEPQPEQVDEDDFFEEEEEEEEGREPYEEFDRNGDVDEDFFEEPQEEEELYEEPNIETDRESIFTEELRRSDTQIGGVMMLNKKERNELPLLSENSEILERANAIAKERAEAARAAEKARVAREAEAAQEARAAEEAKEAQRAARAAKEAEAARAARKAEAARAEQAAKEAEEARRAAEEEKASKRAAKKAEKEAMALTPLQTARIQQSRELSTYVNFAPQDALVKAPGLSRGLSNVQIAKMVPHHHHVITTVTQRKDASLPLEPPPSQATPHHHHVVTVLKVKGSKAPEKYFKWPAPRTY